MKGAVSAHVVEERSEDLVGGYLRAPEGAGEGLADRSADQPIADREFRLLADTIPTLCWMANGDGYIFWYNRRWYDYTGTTPEQMEGWGWRSVHDPVELPGVMDRWTASIATGAPFEMTFPLRGADGVYRPFLTRGEPARDASGRIVRWFGVNTDVSELRQAETALQDTEALARRVLDGMAEGFAIMDTEFRVRQLNAEALRMEQRPVSEIIGRTHWEVWPGSEDNELGRLYKKALAERTPVSLEHCYRWEHGREAWLEMRAYPASNGLAVFWRDITERKRAEQALRETQRRLDAVLNNASVAIFLMNEQQHCVYMNASAERLTGYTLAETQGRPLHDVVHHKRPDGSPYPREECPIDRARPERNQMQGEEIFVHRDGSFYPVAFTASPVSTDDGSVVGTVIEVRDISEEKRREADLRENENRLRLMVNELNHRVKNNLATVQAIAAQTLRGTESLPQARDAFMSRLLALGSAHDVLTREQWEGALLAEIARGVLDPLCGGEGERLSMAGPPILLGPRGALSIAMALHELCTNALKYGALSTPEGHVDLAWRVEAAGPGEQLRLIWRERGGPRVVEPAQRGFGSRLLERGLGPELRGTVTIDYAPEGVVCTFLAPLVRREDGPFLA